MLVCKPAQHSRYRQKMNLAPETVRWHKKNALQKIRKAMEKYLMGAYIDLLKAAQSGDTAAATVLYR